MSLGLLGGAFGCGCVGCSCNTFMAYSAAQQANLAQQANVAQNDYNTMLNYAAQQYHPPVPPPKPWEEGWRELQSEWEKIP